MTMQNIELSFLCQIHISLIRYDVKNSKILLHWSGLNFMLQWLSSKK